MIKPIIKIEPRVQTLKLSQLVEGQMFKFPKGKRYYAFEGKGYRKFWYVDGKGEEYDCKFDATVEIVSP
jgi:hypothetical protein